MEKIYLYLPSARGFCTESDRPFLSKLIKAIKRTDQRLEVIDPWVLGDEYNKAFEEAGKIADKGKRITRLHKIDMDIGRGNKYAIDRSRALVAICNGLEIDAGVVSEITYASINKKPTLVYRNDFRPAGENEGVKVNLQFQYFIEAGKGRFVSSLSQIPGELRGMLKQARII
jgi:hypothetical protein